MIGSENSYTAVPPCRATSCAYIHKDTIEKNLKMTFKDKRIKFITHLN